MPARPLTKMQEVVLLTGLAGSIWPARHSASHFSNSASPLSFFSRMKTNRNNGATCTCRCRTEAHPVKRQGRRLAEAWPPSWFCDKEGERRVDSHKQPQCASAEGRRNCDREHTQKQVISSAAAEHSMDEDHDVRRHWPFSSRSHEAPMLCLRQVRRLSERQQEALGHVVAVPMHTTLLESMGAL